MVSAVGFQFRFQGRCRDAIAVGISSQWQIRYSFEWVISNRAQFCTKNSCANVCLSITFMNVSAIVRIPVHMRSQVIERNGEHYVQINDSSAAYQVLGDFRMDIKLNTLVPEMIKDAVNEQANSNWRRLKPQIVGIVQNYLSDMVREAVTPIFDNVPIRDFFLLSNRIPTTNKCWTIMPQILFHVFFTHFESINRAFGIVYVGRVTVSQTVVCPKFIAPP